jgi:predicted nucleotidyltransferase component of viral defense system
MLSQEQIRQFYVQEKGVSERNMLREYLQYKILKIIFDSEYAARLSFIGGTAIRIVHGSDRFSEDLDFDHFGLSLTNFKSLVNLVQRTLAKEGLETEVKIVSRGAWRCYLKIPNLLHQFGLSSYPEEKIVVQLDTTPQDFKFKPDLKIINKFGVFAEIRVNPLPILLSQKIVAILSRKRILGRDLYDMVYLSSLTEPEMGYLKKKIASDSLTEIKERIQKRLRNYKTKNLAKDILPFVADESRLAVVEKFGQWLEDWPRQTKRPS